MEPKTDLLCYCFHVDKENAKNPKIKEFVIEQTKKGNYACEIKNPSGKCCLKNFPK